jgi:hypothetical protein
VCARRANRRLVEFAALDPEDPRLVVIDPHDSLMRAHCWRPFPRCLRGGSTDVSSNAPLSLDLACLAA